MRIYDSNIDYYDSICRSYKDDLLFVRKEQEIDLLGLGGCNIPFYTPEYLYSIHDEPFTIKPKEKDFKIDSKKQFSIIFCGKIYHGIHIIKTSVDRTINDYIYNYNDLKELYHVEDSNFYYKYRNYNYKIYDKYVSILELWKNNELSEMQKKFIFDNKIVMAFYGYYRDEKLKEDLHFKYNGAFLKDFKFNKVFSHQQVYQELSMFIGGVLPNQGKEIIELDDKYKIQKAGFDLKQSFRHRKD